MRSIRSQNGFRPVPAAKIRILPGGTSCKAKPRPLGLLILTSEAKLPERNSLVNFPLSYFLMNKGTKGWISSG